MEVVKELKWVDVERTCMEACLMNPDGTMGVRFSMQYLPTCHRRGQHRLLVEVLPTRYHNAWGCFDDQDQPMRYYHLKENGLSEANELAVVLTSGFTEGNT